MRKPNIQRLQNKICYQVFAKTNLGTTPLSIWNTAYEAALDVKRWKQDRPDFTFEVYPIVKRFDGKVIPMVSIPKFNKKETVEVPPNNKGSGGSFAEWIKHFGE